MTEGIDDDGRVFDSCTTCGIRLVERGATVFMCPGCGEVKIGRCVQCRDQSAPYRCSGCGFLGP